MKNANWIRIENAGDNCPLFRKRFETAKVVKKAVLKISAKGVYEAHLNGMRVGDFILAPGFTSYKDRIQYQEYDVTEYIGEKNTLVIQVAPGWYKGQIAQWWSCAEQNICAIIAELDITYLDGTSDLYLTDTDWEAAASGLEFCEIYDGFRFDATKEPKFNLKPTIDSDNDLSVLIPQVGEDVVEHERLNPIEVIHTPKGETVLDFGQNMVGVIEVTVNAAAGDEIRLSFAEILDKDGNFYNENYRSAKCRYEYICTDGVQTFKPTLTFYGFRYVRVDSYPAAIDPQNFTAIVVHSRLKRTGNFESSDPMLNQLFRNIVWGQKCNFLDIPTDCPQRDERMGWTGDAQVFVKTASYNFQVETFFEKWLGDMALDQDENGGVPNVVPYRKEVSTSAAWGDAVAICPWQIYLTYGNNEILRKMFFPIKKWVDYVISVTTKENLWFGGNHFGDWLELKAPYGEYKGATRDDLIASAFHARSTELLCKIGDILGEDVDFYKQHYKNVKKAFKEEFKEEFKTQTEYVLTLQFSLTDHPEKVAKDLVEMIHADGDVLQTGFVGTPYLLHVLSDHGYCELAYKLLLRKEYPSWLYPITKGATTIWEHWDGIMPDGSIWPSEMNSYNHYAYGAVGDWLYEVCAGINTVEDSPGFESVRFVPVSTDKIEWIKAEIDTKYGKIISSWRHENNRVIYEITTPVKATALIEGREYVLEPGEYVLPDG